LIPYSHLYGFLCMSKSTPTICCEIIWLYIF
jgi:hypothetical protein